MLRKFCPVSPPITTTSTTTPLPTTTHPLPSECASARNLTEAWRITDRGGSSGITNRDDTYFMVLEWGRPWFRFSGAAGNRIMDTCPPSYSCHSRYSIWSDAPMPTVIGQSKNINVYFSYNNCKRESRTASVMRCSTQPHDYIYKYLGDYIGSGAFCSMRWIAIIFYSKPFTLISEFYYFCLPYYFSKNFSNTFLDSPSRYNLINTIV